MDRLKLIIIFLILNISGTFAQQIYMTRTGKAAIVSNAPLEVIRAESIEMNGAISMTDRTFAFIIDNKSFKGFNSTLQQEHFYENYMEVQDYPVSSFKGKIIEEIDPASSTEQVVRAKGILNIHGVEQERIIKGTVKVTNNKLQLEAGLTVLLEDHQIKIPRVVYQKIAETIDVTISAELILKSE